MKELSLRHNVIYIDYAYTMKDILSKRKDNAVHFSNIFGKTFGIREEITIDNATINVLSLPPIIPINWINGSKLYDCIETINSKIVQKRIMNALNKLNFKPDIIINAFNPFFSKASESIFKNTPLVYYCYDNIDAMQWASKHGSRLEKTLLKSASATVFSSEQLQKTKSLDINSFVVNNGVDTTNFGIYFNSEVNTAKRKIAGYVGSIDDRIDYALLKATIEENMNLDFHFIGKINSQNALELKKYNNVTFFGPKSAEDLPGLMSTFDAGLIPFVKNDFTKNIYPMKVNEYLALGIPVIMTDFADLSDLAGYTEVTKNAKEFSEALNRSLENDNQNARIARHKKAFSNSWQEKGYALEKIILRYA